MRGTRQPLYMFLSVLRRVQGTPCETGQLETALRDSDPAVQSTAAALAGDVVQTISVPQLRSLATHHLSQVPAPKSRMDLEFACCLQASSLTVGASIGQFPRVEFPASSGVDPCSFCVKVLRIPCKQTHLLCPDSLAEARASPWRGRVR